jgi:hypothetical protein
MKFKNGDRVRITNLPNGWDNFSGCVEYYLGKEAIVTDNLEVFGLINIDIPLFNDGSDLYKTLYKNGMVNSTTIFSDCLELVLKFKVGDRVKFVKDLRGNQYTPKLGDIGTISYIDGNEYMVDLDGLINCGGVFFEEGELELLTEVS